MGNNLKKLRASRKITQKELADKLNINNTSLSRMENGTHSISDEQLISLADYFNVSIDYILDREIESPTSSVVTKDFNTEDIIKKLNKLSNKDLYKLNGVIEFLLDSRDEPIINEQKGQNIGKVKY